MIKDKRGMSLAEILAVIAIMGIIATVATASTIAVIGRQRKNATLSSLDTIFHAAKSELVQESAKKENENIIWIDNDFIYISLTTMIDSNIVDGEKYKPVGNEVFFCYDMHDVFVEITDGEINKNRPETTGITVIDNLQVTFDYSKNQFVIA